MENQASSAQVSLQEALLNELNRIRAKNPAFSMRAYAKRLELSSGALSSILSGQRQVSKKLAEKIMAKMNLDPEVEAGIQALFADRTRAVDQERAQLTLDQFHLISDTIHYAILCLFELKNFKHDFLWMALQLGRSQKDIETACSRLFRLGLLDRNKEGEYFLTGALCSTPDNISSSSLRRFHQQGLAEAEDALLNVEVDKRYFLSRTFAVSSKKLPQAQALMREFRERMSELLESNDNDSVYKFSLQLFPMTKASLPKGEKE